MLKAFEDYITVEMRFSKNSIHTYVHECTMFSSYCDELNISLTQASSKIVIDFLIRRQLNGASQRTIAKSLSSLRSFYKFTVIEEICDQNPAEMVEMPKIKTKVPKVFNHSEIDQFFLHIDTSTTLGIRDLSLIHI